VVEVVSKPGSFIAELRWKHPIRRFQAAPESSESARHGNTYLWVTVSSHMTPIL
jgi:hypothetical protein